MARNMTTERVGTDPYNGQATPESPPPGGRGGNRAVIGVLVWMLVGALAWGFIATFVDDEEPAGPEAGITLSELASDPEGLFGSRVVVSGEVNDVVGGEDVVTPEAGAATGFVMGEGDQSVLVLGSRIPQLAALGTNADIADGDVVQVTGTVREFDLAALEEDLGADLADEEFAAYEGRPVLMASAVNLVPTTAMQQGEQIALSVDELTDSPAEYLTQRITVRDFTVDDPADVLSPRAFALGEDIIVVGASGPTNVSPGFTGTMTGTLIEASTARLLNAVNLPESTAANDLFDDFGIDEQEFAAYDYAFVANEFRPTN
jgi:hypothetical protein